MACHVLTDHGLKVLLLEAGKKLPIEKELRSMEWPYDNKYRGGLPPDSHSLSFNEYTIRRPPYGPGFEHDKHLKSYIGDSDYVKNITVDERDNPYTGTNYAWVRARCLGGKTNIWGRLSLRLSDYDFKAHDRDGFGENWPISYSDISPYYDKVDLYLGVTGVKEGLEWLPDSIFQRPTKLNCAEVTLQQALKTKLGRTLTQYRAGVTTDGLKHNKYRSRCYGRGACERKGGCDIHAAFDSPTGLIYPAADTGNLTIRTNAVVREITTDPDNRQSHRCPLRRQRNHEGLSRQSEGRRARCLHARIRSPAPAFEIADASERLGQLQHPRRPQLLRTHHGPGHLRSRQKSRRQDADARRRSSRRLLSRALPQSERKESQLHPRLRLRRWRRLDDVPGRHRSPRLRRKLQGRSPQESGCVHRHGRVRRSPCALRKLRRPRSCRERQVGCSRASIPLQVR